MLLNLYNQLIIMSIVAGGLYLILKLSSVADMKCFTASWHYYTYVAVYMFLLVPYHKIVSLFHLNFSQPSQSTENGFAPPSLPSIMRLPLSANNDFVAVADKAESISTLNIDFLPYFLIAGTLVFIVVILIQNIKLYRRIFGVCRLADEAQFQDILPNCKQEMGVSNHVRVYISPYASTPFLYGVLKPRIVLPDMEFTEEELRHVFQHELTHWKRHDAWLKCLMLLINAIHWFNPLAYIARHDIDRFCELSCDESVVISMNKEERRRYCELMLGVLWHVTGHNVKLFSAFSDRRKQLERRMDMIMKIEGLKSKKWVRMLAITMTLAFVLAGAVTAYATNNTGGQANVTGEPTVVEPRDTGNTSSTALAASVKEVGPKSASVEKSDTKVKSDVGIEAVYNIDWDVYAYEDAYGTSQLSISKGAAVQYNISWSPQPGVIRVGLYNRNTGNFYWAASSTTSPLKGTITVPETGLYSFAVGNRTDTDVHVTGSFTY